MSKEQLDQLLQLLKPAPPTPGTPIASVAQSGSLSCAYFLPLSAPWIIDSGVSNHMTNLPHLFISYTPCFGNKKVRIADGSLSYIARQASIHLSDKIVLQSVLHVQKLYCNILSVSRLSKDSNCHVVVCASLCEFQDLNSGMMFSNARLIDNLYNFDDNRNENKQAQGLIAGVRSIPMHDQIMLWHNTLGHPNFFYLKHLFPGLFKDWIVLLLIVKLVFWLKAIAVLIK